MNVLIVAPKEVYQITEIISELEKKGHKANMLDMSLINIDNIIGESEEIFKNTDLVYFRTGPDNVVKKYLVKILEKKGIKILNARTYDNPLYTDKLNQMLLSKENNIAVPKTISLNYGDFNKTHKKLSAFYHLSNQLGSPFIAKIRNGSKGESIFKIGNEENFKKFTVEVNSYTENYIFQEFIENDGDFRVICTRDEVIGMFKRVPNAGEFRANFSLGGTAEKVNDEQTYIELSDLALKIMRSLDLDLAGIDLVFSNSSQQYYFFEINRSMQWRGFKEATGINVAEEVVNFMERQV